MARPMANGSAAITPDQTSARLVENGPIDRVHLAKQCLGDENLELEILGLFDTTIEVYLERLRVAPTKAQLGQILHTLKGASLGVGAMALADIAREAEQLLQAEDLVADETIADIAMAVEEVRAFIAQLGAEAAL